MAKSYLNEKSPREDQNRRDHQQAVKRSMIELSAFGLTLIAASVKVGGGYDNYELPTDPDELDFTLKGALRLEMMNSGNALWMKYRRLFGSNTKAGDLSAWRSRVYIEAYDSGKSACEAAEAMKVPGQSVGLEKLTAEIEQMSGAVVLMQVNDVFLADDRTYLFSDLLRTFIERDSELLESIGFARILPVWKELAE